MIDVCSEFNCAVVINERRQKLWTLLTRGMKGYEIARELNTNNSTSAET
jgi:DNA-binding NarL/FixJ family response regulator